ncbi:hypothetical protein EIN_170650 [Entamoeba invadens IP1]|uniref:CBM20 domain-containing protein n=1 Tax=Entamoeba invadens IP1 TaxID=370355 RepID=A0A0A1TYB9_ENTIV|nr:hypothetical protein EIN_170650 [Entamoeba invadens IP1]ELP84540.1 hypothetical protein EIN_170650 [Entamoeba invadens IP1]|eukprot:XP_004183886.1 hypothetical protein EIN_170650 [Entamoeba invadens IP1]
MTKFQFNINYKTTLGCKVAVVGSCKELGEWQHGILMTWTSGNNWRCEVEITNVPFEYKYQITDERGNVFVWEATQNRLVQTTGLIDQSQPKIASIAVSDVWEQPSNTHFELKKKENPIGLRRANSKEWDRN